MSIEDVAAKDPSAIKKHPVDITGSLSREAAVAFAAEMEFSPASIDQVCLYTKLHDCYSDRSFIFALFTAKIYPPSTKIRTSKY